MQIMRCAAKRKRRGFICAETCEVASCKAVSGIDDIPLAHRDAAKGAERPTCNVRRKRRSLAYRWLRRLGIDPSRHLRAVDGVGLETLSLVETAQTSSRKNGDHRVRKGKF